MVEQFLKLVPETVAAEPSALLAQYSAPPWFAAVLFSKLPPFSVTTFATVYTEPPKPLPVVWQALKVVPVMVAAVLPVWLIAPPLPKALTVSKLLPSTVSVPALELTAPPSPPVASLSVNAQFVIAVAADSVPV